MIDLPSILVCGALLLLLAALAWDIVEPYYLRRPRRGFEVKRKEL